MHRMNNFKILNAQNARIIYNYKNTKEKLLKTIAALWFSKTYRFNHLTPLYIHVNINDNNIQYINHCLL
jgi:hypothetical protein